MAIPMGIKKTVEAKVNAKTLKIHMKVCDTFCAELVDDQGGTIGKIEGQYVPNFMPEEHYGDYLILDIDIETGQITNWEKPTAEDLQEAFVKEED